MLSKYTVHLKEKQITALDEDEEEFNINMFSAVFKKDGEVYGDNFLFDDSVPEDHRREQVKILIGANIKYLFEEDTNFEVTFKYEN